MFLTTCQIPQHDFGKHSLQIGSCPLFTKKNSLILWIWGFSINISIFYWQFYLTQFAFWTEGFNGGGGGVNEIFWTNNLRAFIKHYTIINLEYAGKYINSKMLRTSYSRSKTDMVEAMRNWTTTTIIPAILWLAFTAYSSKGLMSNSLLFETIKPITFIKTHQHSYLDTKVLLNFF